jgi:hypothetical protein
MSVIDPYRFASDPTTDPFFASVVQLAHFDGADGSTTLTNSCARGNTMAVGGGGTIQSSQSKFGGASYLTSSVGGRAVAATHADYAMGTSDFCFEWYQRITSLALDFNSAKFYLDMRPSALTNGWYPTVYASVNNGELRAFMNGADRITAGAGTIVAATWQLITLARVSGTTRLFVDGAQVGSSFTDANTYVQSSITLGAAGNNAGAALGYYDDLRITNGAGRYSSNFTPRTSAFPNS